MAAHQAPPSLGFSRQEHWSGLPFPSPMHESEKWKWSHSVVSHSQRPHGLQPTRLLHPWDFPGKSTYLYQAPKQTCPLCYSLRRKTKRKEKRKKGRKGAFPGCPVVNTLPSNAGGMSSIPGQRSNILPASWPRNQNVKQKQCCNKFNKDFKTSKKF